jgi:cytochrome P450
MRVRPAAPVTLRHVDKDFVMNDVLVPAGTILLVYINAIHKRADVYPDPDVFDPERFIGESRHPHPWLTFGGGAYRCLGGPFALFEARVLLRTILKHRALAPDASPGERQDQHRSVLLSPHKAGTVTLLPR